LQKKPKYKNDSLILKEKNALLFFLLNNTIKNISSIDTIYFSVDCHFGNCLILLNKIIFFCEIVECKNIILDKNIFWFIKNNIIDKKYNLTISVSDTFIKNNCSIICNSFTIYHTLFFIKPEIRINILKNEILSNLPIIKTNINDLYIHIRSGDIFNTLALTYSQPPLCFYSNIINNFSFKNIYIISSDRKNPVFKKLIKIFPSILYNKNNISTDIATLIYAFNIVGSISSFLISSIKFNENLKYFWEYNIYRMIEKIYHLHNNIYKYSINYTIFRMESSFNYKNRMYNWNNKYSQKILMIKEKCINNFKIIKQKKM